MKSIEEMFLYMYDTNETYKCDDILVYKSVE